MAAGGRRPVGLGMAAVSAATMLMVGLVPERASAQQPVGTTGVALPDLGEPMDPAVQAAVTLLQDKVASIPRIYVIDPARLHLKTPRAAFRV